MTHTITKLKSGITLVCIPLPSVKSVSVLTLANTGSRYEQPATQGIAHFFEHIVFKGTEAYPNPELLSGTIDGIGADYNAFTSKEYTGYYVKAASRHLELALDVVSDMVLRPLIKPEDIDRERGVIVEELNMYADHPARHIANLFEQMVFKGSGLGHDIIGTKATIQSVTADDFQHFLQSWYGLENLVVVLAGDARRVKGDLAQQLVEKSFDKLTNERATGKVKVDRYLSEDPITPQRFHLEHRKTEQTHFVLGWPGIKRSDPDEYVADLLMTILGGTMSSRLFMEVREKRGLCYYIRSNQDQFHDTGIVGASAGVDPSRVEEALRVTIEEFMMIATGQRPITQAELSRAQEYISGKMILSLEDSLDVAQFYGMRQLLTDQIETPDEVLAKFRAITLDDLHRVAKRLLQPGQARLAVIGDFTDPTPFEQLIA